MTLCLAISLLPVTALAEGGVAEVAGDQYATLAEAVGAAESGQTIKMLANADISTTGLTIPSSKALTLDLNGKEIKANNTANGRISVYGSLTIQDSTDTNFNGTGNGKIYTETDYNSSTANACMIASIGENALVTLESGYIYAVRDDASNKGQFGLGVIEGGDLTITGGKVEAGWYAVSGNGDNNTQNSVIDIQGGKLISTADYAVYLPQSGTTNITGGTIYGAAGGVSIQRGNLNISGNALITSKGTGDTGNWGDGTGGQGCAALNVNAKYGDCIVSISGSTLTAEEDAVVIAKGTANHAGISITGGNFSSDVTKYIGVDYVCTGSDTSYTVSAKQNIKVDATKSSDTVNAVVGGKTIDTSGKDGVSSVDNTTLTINTTVSDASNVNTANVTVGAVAMDTIKNSTYTDMAITTNVGTLTVDQAALRQLITNATEDGKTADVTLNIQKQPGDKWVVTATANGKEVFMDTNAGGNTIDVTVDYTLAADSVEVYCLDSGKVQQVGSKYEEGKLTWYAPHFSTYGAVAKNSDDEATWVTKNGTMGSGTLTEAVVAMKFGGGTITLQKNIDNLEAGSTTGNNAVITLPAGTTLDGNGKKISAGEWALGSDGEPQFHILGVADISSGEANRVTVKNLTIVGNNTTKHGFNAYGNKNTPDVTLENVTIQDCGTAAVVINHAKVIIQNLTTSGNAWGAVNVDKGGTLDLRGNGNNMAEPAKIWTEANSDTTVATAYSNYVSFNVVTGVGPNLKGHVYYTDDVSELGAAYNETTKTIYESLDEALRDAVSGQTVTVVKDTALADNAVVDEDVTLEIENGVKLEIPAGKKLTNNGTIQNSGTINGTVESGSGATAQSTVTFVVTPSNAAVTVTQNGSTVSGTNGVYLLNNGTYTYTITANGYYSYTGSFTVSGNAQTIRVALTQISYGGGGSSSRGDYLVSVKSSKNGKVTVSPSRADKGDTVTITVKPDDGYELDTLTVTDKNGDTVKVTHKSADKYTFTMPASKVTIEATFAEISVDLPFTDVAESAWYYDAVQFVYENELMNGVTATTFSPNVTTSRAMIATILYRLEGEPRVTTGSFSDVESGMYYADAVAWASAKGIVTGYEDGTFAPNKAISREEMAMMLYRYASYKGYNVTNMKDLDGYSDADSVSAYAVEALQWATGEGLITDMGDGTLNPQGSAVRAQVATILMRFLGE